MYVCEDVIIQQMLEARNIRGRPTFNQLLPIEKFLLGIIPIDIHHMSVPV